MTTDWTVLIAVATSTTAIIGLVTLLILDQQRRINQNTPLYLFPSDKIELLGLLEREAEGKAGEELKMGMPSIVRHPPAFGSSSWSSAVDKLIRYGLAEVLDGHLRITDAGQRYAWKKYHGDVRSILLRTEENKNRPR